MPNKIITGLLGSCICSIALYAQDAPKWNLKVQQALEKYEQQQALTRGALVCDTIPTILRCNDSAEVSSLLTEKGIPHTIISEHVVTATMPVDQVRTVCEETETQYMSAAEQLDPFMLEARQFVHADEMAAGTGLETPFTGKGVVLGVIDMGFEYSHPIYKDSEGNLRIKAIWNRYKKQDKITDPELILKEENDGMDATHGTLTSSIAAASKVNGVPYEGIATDAELILISSQLYENEILEGARYIKDYARAHNKAAVVNMSFGGTIGHAHDGTGTLVTPFNELSDVGCLFVAAAGNDGSNPIHASKQFTSATDTARVLVDYVKGDWMYVDIWGTKNARGFSCKPFVLDTETGKETDIQQATWNSICSASQRYNVYGNQLENTYLAISYTKLQSAIGTGLGTTKKLGLYITGPEGSAFHAWTQSSNTKFASPSVTTKEFVIPDSEYTLGAPSTAEKVVCTASYNSSTLFTDINGVTRDYGFTVSDLSNFSSHGPLLESDLAKPTITAPGAAIKSAVSKQTSNFDSKSWNLIRRVSQNRKSYYYGISTGTSCATPIVAGTIACWLQAYPALTYEQAEQILRKTAINDEYTKNEEGGWNNKWGYGKLDAYAGLKECLKLAHATGVNDMQDTTEPVTLLKTNTAWRVLFNNTESFADITLFTLDGRNLRQIRISDVPCAHEEIIDLQGYTPGVYVLQIRTANHTVSRKIMKY